MVAIVHVLFLQVFGSQWFGGPMIRDGRARCLYRFGVTVTRLDNAVRSLCHLIWQRRFECPSDLWVSRLYCRFGAPVAAGVPWRQRSIRGVPWRNGRPGMGGTRTRLTARSGG